MFYDVLGDSGYHQHRLLSDLDLSSRRHKAVEQLFEEVVGHSTSYSPQLKGSQVELSDTTIASNNEDETLSPKRPRPQVDISALAKTPKTSNEARPSTGSIVPIHWATFPLLSEQDRAELLEEVRSSDSSSNEDDIVLAIICAGSSFATDHPRDSAAFFCLYSGFESLIARYHLLGHRNEQMYAHSRDCLLRCLELSNQSTSNGMIGWLEYGEEDCVTSQQIKPTMVLEQLAKSCVRKEDWKEAESIMWMVLLKYESRLDSHHPCLVSAMLLLGSISRRVDFGDRRGGVLLSSASQRVTQFLLAAEMDCFSYLNSCNANRPRVLKPIFCIERGPETLQNLYRFVSSFQECFRKDQNHLIDFDVETKSLQHRLYADSLAVLANTLYVSQVQHGYKPVIDREDPSHYWKLGFAHYRLAFQGYSQNHGFEDVRVSGTAYGMARCLRELGRSAEALELLSLVISSLETIPNIDDSVVQPTRARLQRSRTTPTSNESPKDPKKAPRPLARLFHLQFQSNHKITATPRVQHHTTRACCLWLMAILMIDRTPTESSQPFRLLHAASVSIQLALNELPDDVSAGIEQLRFQCVEFLELIEHEAKRISLS